MRHSKLIIPLAAIALLGAGCPVGIKQQATGADGGLYRSQDSGDTWEHPAAVPTAKGVGTIAGVDAMAIAFDPSDPRAVYLGTAANGLLYSYDDGSSWTQAAGIASGRVPAVAVSPADKCTVYAALANRAMKSTDCNRSYQIAYVDSRAEANVTALVVDGYNPSQVYIGTETGEVLRSADSGATWAVLKRFDDPVRKIVISSRDSRTILVGLRSRGISRTTDAGATWTDLVRNLDNFSAARIFADLTEIPSEERAYLHASRFGLLKTSDNGDTWQAMNILTPPESVTIYSLAVNPRNGNEIYYGTANTLYRSGDGGQSWVTKKLPTTRAATALAVDPEAGNILYMGAARLQK